MANQHLSEPLKRFIKEKIQTILRLEVLLLLHHQQSRSFSVAEVADELGFDEESAQDQLMSLEAIGVVFHSNSDKPTYKYHPLNPTLGSMVEELAVGYSRRRVPILSVMLAEHPDRTRLFTEAFKIIRND